MPPNKKKQKQQKADDDTQRWRNKVYNRYIPLASGQVCFEFRGRWFTQDKKGPLLHPKVDTKVGIKDCLLALDKAHGRGFRDDKRYDQLKKEDLVTKLMQYLGPGEIFALDKKKYPINRIVYYPSHPYSISCDTGWACATAVAGGGGAGCAVVGWEREQEGVHCEEERCCCCCGCCYCFCCYCLAACHTPTS